MDLFQADKSVDQSEVALIDWSTPPMVKNNNNVDCIINNPFDMMESKASNMDPFDLVFNETPIKREPPCGNILSPLWVFRSRPLRKSVSLTDISGVAKILEHVKVDKLNDDHTILLCVDREVVDQSKENCAQVHIEDNKIIGNEENKIVEIEENKIESILTIEHNEINLEKDIEKNSVCSEDEKKIIREQTRQRIQMLIEKGKKDYEEECSRKSLFCTPLRNNNSSLNKSESLFNRGFLQSGSLSYNDGINKIHENVTNKNDSNKSNFSPTFHDSELNSFDLNSLKPEWVMDNFSDSDGSVDIQIQEKSRTTELTYNNNNDIDTKLKALNRIGIIESKPNACHISKFTQNKKSQNKGPFLANVPLQQMIQNYENEETKDIIHAPVSPRGQMKPVASSTPTTDIMATCKTPSTVESSIKSRTNISRQSMPTNSIDSLSSPLNVTKCNEKNLSFDIDGNILSLTNVSHSVTSAKKPFNTTTVLNGGANEKKLKMAEITEKMQSFKLNKSKSLSKIGKIPKPMALSTNKISGLPVPKRFSNSVSIPFKGKENMKPHLK